MKTLALICLSFGMAPILCAQQPAAQPSVQPTPRPVLPPGPLLNKAADFAQWTVTSKSSTAPAAAAQASASPATAAVAVPGASPGQKQKPSPSDQTTSVTKTKTIRFEETITAGGIKIQKWCVPDMQVSIHGSGAPVVSLPSKSGDNYYTDYSKSDFGGFEWISSRNFTGIEKIMGQDCLVFRDKMKFAAGDAPAGPPPPVVACIDADSRLPVALQLGDEIRTFQFGPTPAAMLTLPPPVQTVVDGWRKTMRQAALPPGKP